MLLPRWQEAWRGSGRELSSKKFSSWSKASLSNIFDSSGKMAMGLVSEIVERVGVFNNG